MEEDLKKKIEITGLARWITLQREEYNNKTGSVELWPYKETLSKRLNFNFNEERKRGMNVLYAAKTKIKIRTKTDRREKSCLQDPV